MFSFGAGLERRKALALASSMIQDKFFRSVAEKKFRLVAAPRPAVLTIFECEARKIYLVTAGRGVLPPEQTTSLSHILDTSERMGRFLLYKVSWFVYILGRN